MLVVAALSLLAQLATPRAHFRIVSDFAEPERAAEASQAAEAVVPVVLARLGRGGWTPRSLETIRLYRGYATFRARTAEFNPNAPEVLGFTHRDSRTSHVAAEPWNDALHALGLPRATRRLVAHEAAHLVCYDLLRDMDELPAWMVEGLADSAAQEALVQLGLADALEVDPATASRIAWVQEFARTGRLPSFDALVNDRLGDYAYLERYPLRWLAYEFLRAEQPGACAQLFAAAYDDGRTGAPRRVRAALEPLWSAAEREALDARLRAWLAEFHPRWRPCAGLLEGRAQGYLSLADASGDALALSTTTLATLPVRLSGALSILPGTNTQLHVVLGHTRESFLEVAFTAGVGVTVWRYDCGAERWSLKGSAPALELVTEREFTFQIEADADELEVWLAGKSVLRVPLHGDSPLGTWGLGAQASAGGCWSDIEVASGR
ncbi:MAG: hypothetical protein EXS08_00385 [Planctomycetes bacterium]|nr:hypothetical protein [Planctomycetota bacterium]